MNQLGKNAKINNGKIKKDGSELNIRRNESYQLTEDQENELFLYNSFSSENNYRSQSKSLEDFRTSDCINQITVNSDSLPSISSDVIYHIRTPDVAQSLAKRKRDVNDTEGVQNCSDDSVSFNNQYPNNQRYHSDLTQVEIESEIKLPPFLAGLKSKRKKLCECGLPAVRIPLKWSQKMHDELHANAAALNLPKKMLPDAIKRVKRPTGLSYTILRFDNSYHDKSVAGIRNYVSLELGISETGVRFFQRTVFISVLMPTDTKVIGYLEVEPAQVSRQLNINGTLSEIQFPVKYGISKIWVNIKYRHQHVGTSMIDFFRLTYSLTKDDIAFASHDIRNIKFLQKYKCGSPILIYTESSAWNR